jgi:hypothetical protein
VKVQHISGVLCTVGGALVLYTSILPSKAVAVSVVWPTPEHMRKLY